MDECSFSVQSIHPSRKRPGHRFSLCACVSSCLFISSIIIIRSFALSSCAFSLFLFNRFPSSPLLSLRVAGPSQCCTHHITSHTSRPSRQSRHPHPTDRQIDINQSINQAIDNGPSIHPSIQPCRRRASQNLAGSVDKHTGRQADRQTETDQTYRRHPHTADPFVCLFRVSCVCAAPCRLSVGRRKTKGERQSGCVYVGVHVCEMWVWVWVWVPTDRQTDRQADERGDAFIPSM